MKFTNYCRQMVSMFSDAISNKRLSPDQSKTVWSALMMENEAKKFMLPDGGRLYDDHEFRALDESIELHLPYKKIALEYVFNQSSIGDGMVGYSKSIVLAQELEEWIVFQPCFYIDKTKSWSTLPPAKIPKVNYLDRNQKNKDGYVGIKIGLLDEQIPLSDYQDELGALLCFLNTLSCSNVKIERQDREKQPKKQAIPFDTYHILKICNMQDSHNSINKSSSRSPREHLRRGHIRRLSDGRKLWINATVVAAGASGKVSKDYTL